MARITRHPGPRSTLPATTIRPKSLDKGTPSSNIHHHYRDAGSDRTTFLTSGYQEKYNEVFDKKQGKENLN